MLAIIIASFCVGLMFGGVAVAAVSMSELKRLRKIVKGVNQ